MVRADKDGPTRIVAFGGGHGLATCLQALRRLPDVELTAVVTVGDNGGSSGRLRAERGVLPPGDLRQALAALASSDPFAQRTAELLQHRFGSAVERSDSTPADPLAGHTVGNLLLCGLMELYRDPVAAVAHAAALVRACGTVLPMSPEPVSIEARVRGADPARPDRVELVRGQHQVAVTRGRVELVRLTPAAPPACVQALTAVQRADWLVFGPGSWYTSVIPHLLVPQLAAAVLASPARRLITLNLAAELETASLSQPDHLAALTRYLPGLQADVVLADQTAVGDPEPVGQAAALLGARLILAPVALADGTPRHDPVALAGALWPIMAANPPSLVEARSGPASFSQPTTPVR